MDLRYLIATEGISMDIRQTHVVLRAKNFERTSAFYGETLSLPRLRSWESQEDRGACFLAGSAEIEVRGRLRSELGDLRDEAYEYQGPDHKITLTFIVASAEKAYEELLFRDRNIPGGLRQSSDGTMLFETHDPDGVKILYRESDF